jgi:hypothetical protein
VAKIIPYTMYFHTILILAAPAPAPAPALRIEYPVFILVSRCTDTYYYVRVSPYVVSMINQAQT